MSRCCALVVRLTPLALALLAADASAGVIRVPGDYLHVQVAVNNAAEGDLILVAPGSYPDAIDLGAKSLAIVSDGGTASFVKVRVHDLAADQVVVLRGIGAAGPFNEGLVVKDCAGRVVVEDGAFTGSDGRNSVGDPLWHPSGWPAVVVEQTQSVDLVRCTLTGGDGASIGNEKSQVGTGTGGSGLSASEADVGLHESTSTGGTGGTTDDTVSTPGGGGGHGALHAGGLLFAAGCSLTGKNGGSADCSFFACGSGGGGGSGVSIGGEAVTTFWSQENDFHWGSGGSGGSGSTGGASEGSNGAAGKPIDVQAGGVNQWIPWRQRTLRATSITRELHPLTFDVTGAAGDMVWTWISVTPDWLMLPGHGGALLVDRSTSLPLLLGVVPASGSLSTQFMLPDLGPGVDELTVLAQGVFVAGGQSFLGSASAATLLDASF